MILDRLLDRAPCGFVSLGDDGTLLAVNQTLAELLGYARAELEGWHVQKILPPGGRIFYQTHVYPLLKLHGHADELYLTLRTKESGDIPMLMNGVRHERGGSLVTDCVFVRMLQRNEYEEQLLAARRLAEQANAARAKFLSMMSHDLRTPLTTIFGHSTLLAQEVHGPLTDDQRYAIARMRDAGGELLRMINDILSFAQMETGNVAVRLSPVPVVNAISRAESLVRLRIEQAGLTFDVDACDGETAVRADPDRLQQVLLNLLTNAVKFTGPGGRVSVTCEPASERVRIRVSDTGVGIPDDQRERIFEPFVQLASQLEGIDRGVGLGLAISRDLVRAMDGDLSVASGPDGGSTFTVELPRAI